MKVSGYADDGSSQKSRKAPGRVGESQRDGSSGIRRSKSSESGLGGGGARAVPRGPEEECEARTENYPVAWCIPVHRRTK